MKMILLPIQKEPKYEVEVTNTIYPKFRIGLASWAFSLHGCTEHHT